jgi:hypothetical protein
MLTRADRDRLTRIALQTTPAGLCNRRMTLCIRIAGPVCGDAPISNPQDI